MKKVKMDKDFQIFDKETDKWCDTVFSKDGHNAIMGRLTLYSEDTYWRYYKTSISLSFSELFRKRKKICSRCGAKL